MPREDLLAGAEKLRSAGQLEKAAGAYRQHLAGSPRDAETRRKLGEILLKLGKVDGAISEYFKVQETLTASGDILGAIAAGRKITQIDPKFNNPLSYVAMVQAQSLEQDQKKMFETQPYKPVKPLPQIPLLADLLPSELAAVAENMKVHEKGEEDIIFSQGDPGDSIFFVTRGLLEVAAGSSKLGRLEAGDCFGEFSFLTGQPRTATVRVIEAAELLELSAADMKQVVRSHPRVREVLFRLYCERAMENVLARSPLFEMLGVRDREKVAARLELVALKPGETLFRQGSEGDSLYLMKSGQVEVRCEAPGGGEVNLATLGPHQFFGEVSFLTGVPRTATVTALGDCELLKLAEPDLRRLVDDHPELAEVLRRYHLNRVLATAETLKAFLKQRQVDGILR